MDVHQGIGELLMRAVGATYDETTFGDVRKTIETKIWHAAVSSPLLRVFDQGAETPSIDSDQLDGTVGDGVDAATSTMRGVDV